MTKVMNDREFSLIVPKTDNSGNVIRKTALAKFGKDMAKHFGGSNIDEFIGCWKTDEGNVQCEENIRITSIRDLENKPALTVKGSKEKQFKNDRKFMENLRKKVSNQFGQDVVMGSVDRVEGTAFLGEEKETAKPRFLRKVLKKPHSINLSEHI